MHTGRAMSNQTKQIPTGKAKAKVLSTEHINAMEKALDDANDISHVFAIVRKTDSIIATHKPTGQEVLRAIRNPANNKWLTRHAKNLFA